LGQATNPLIWCRETLEVKNPRRSILHVDVDVLTTCEVVERIRALKSPGKQDDRPIHGLTPSHQNEVAAAYDRARKITVACRVVFNAFTTNLSDSLIQAYSHSFLHCLRLNYSWAGR
jgi:hypothetical protein